MDNFIEYKGGLSKGIIQGDYPKALKKYKESLMIAEKFGNLKSKVTLLNNIAVVYKACGDYPNSLER
ncbi:MAG: hypothetical protein GF329_14035 [Candidatus Lokiarchaeota archaeon]|nr:hypothetical protein [Candidatus Lokiarchaeota archaeon]